MKIKTISRSEEACTRECKGDVVKVFRNLDPALHPFDKAREYTRALQATKLDKVFADAGAEPRRVLEVSTGLCALSMARGGSGVAVICPFPLLRPDDPTIDYRPFRPQFIYRTSFAVSTVRPVSAPVRAFIRHVKLMLRSDAAWRKHEITAPPDAIAQAG